jgi:hypothetical protein
MIFHLNASQTIPGKCITAMSQQGKAMNWLAVDILTDGNADMAMQKQMEIKYCMQVLI